MTCIVGLVDRVSGTIYFGCDSISACTGSGTKRTVKSPKLFRLTASAPGFPDVELVVGFTSSFRMGDILRTMTDLPHPLGGDLETYLRTSFVDHVRRAFAENGFMTKTSEQETGGFFLVGLMGRLFQVQDDFSVLEDAVGRDAIGAGDVIARASLATSDGFPISFAHRVKIALETAEQLNSFVSGPFHFEELRP